METFGDWRKSRKLLSSNCDEKGMEMKKKKRGGFVRKKLPYNFKIKKKSNLTHTQCKCSHSCSDHMISMVKKLHCLQKQRKSTLPPIKKEL